MTKKVTTPVEPTRLLVEKDAKDELVKGRIENATLLYVQMQEGELALNSDTDRNITVQLAVTEDTAKNWKATFPKNGYREVNNEDFVGKYKTEPPYPEEEKQHVLKLKSNATYRQEDLERDIQVGDVVPYDNRGRPKLYEVVDGKPSDITMDVQPANGSKGIVAFRATTNKFGTFPMLSGVLVTELVEAEHRAGIASDFGITDDTPATQRLTPGTPKDSGDVEQENSSPIDDDDDWM